MARVHVVKKSRKAQGKCGKCGKCGKRIKKGSPYRWTKNRRGPRKVRCSELECGFRASDLTGSDKLSRVYSARESAEDPTEEWAEQCRDEFESMLGECPV